jgi:hypothetical protein
VLNSSKISNKKMKKDKIITNLIDHYGIISYLINGYEKNTEKNMFPKAI